MCKLCEDLLDMLFTRLVEYNMCRYIEGTRYLLDVIVVIGEKLSTHWVVCRVRCMHAGDYGEN